MTWLLELLGPQYSGKTTIADLLSITLEENGIPTFRLETDNYLYNPFPIYSKLKATGQRDKAHSLLSKRWLLIHDLLITTTRKGLKNNYTVIHDHIDTSSYKLGVGKRIAKQTGRGYLSILVTAPLETLKERWKQSEISDVRIEELEKTYGRFQTLREELSFNLVIDTSLTTPDEAARQIITTTYPALSINAAAPTLKRSKKLLPSNDANPQICPGDLQILKIKDSYVIVHNHRRYVTDAEGLLILSLCNGKNSAEEIAKIAGTDLETTHGTIDFLNKSHITTAPAQLERVKVRLPVHRAKSAASS